MTRLFKALSAFVLCALILAPRPATAQISADDAAPFLGDWTLKFESPQGPIQTKLKVTSDGGKVTGELNGDLGIAKSTESSKVEKALKLQFTLELAGMTLPGSITLTPDAGKFKATFDVMNGAFTVDGDATKG